MREMKLRLEDLLEDMMVPEERKNLNIKTNIRWLMNNLPLANANHRYLDEAIYLIKSLAKKLRC
jgi:hypothetical protein